jgi:catechol 2,3-dioxygenase-like lactoylglutathione lyase family enzyme
MTASNIVGIDHVQVAVPAHAEEECRAFYVRLLGMGEIEKPPILAACGGIWVASGAQELHCGVEADFKPARKAHPAFAATGIDELAARIAAAGYGVHWDGTNPALRRFFTHDPFGNRLEFVEAKAE